MVCNRVGLLCCLLKIQWNGAFVIPTVCCLLKTQGLGAFVIPIVVFFLNAVFGDECLPYRAGMCEFVTGLFYQNTVFSAVSSSRLEGFL